MSNKKYYGAKYPAVLQVLQIVGTALWLFTVMAYSIREWKFLYLCNTPNIQKKQKEKSKKNKTF